MYTLRVTTVLKTEKVETTNISARPDRARREAGKRVSGSRFQVPGFVGGKRPKSETDSA
jgi:hypothetical protein